jgi:hypothetical protein
MSIIAVHECSFSIHFSSRRRAPGTKVAVAFLAAELRLVETAPDNAVTFDRTHLRASANAEIFDRLFSH